VASAIESVVIESVIIESVGVESVVVASPLVAASPVSETCESVVLSAASPVAGVDELLEHAIKPAPVKPMRV
jgi:hypothetical protein